MLEALPSNPAYAFILAAIEDGHRTILGAIVNSTPDSIATALNREQLIGAANAVGEFEKVRIQEINKLAEELKNEDE